MTQTKQYKGTIPEITLKFKTGEVKKVKIINSQSANDVLRKFYDQDTIALTESFVVLLLNRANNTIGWFKLSQGGLNGTVVDVRLIFTVALKTATHGMILSHNHPGGNVSPSPKDIEITKKIVEAGRGLDIKVLDHIIVSGEGDQYHSMVDEGTINLF